MISILLIILVPVSLTNKTPRKNNLVKSMIYNSLTKLESHSTNKNTQLKDLMTISVKSSLIKRTHKNLISTIDTSIHVYLYMLN